MGLDSIPVLATLKQALDFNTSRARVLAENVANSDTAGFMPKDIARGDFAQALRESGGLSARSDGSAGAWRVSASPDSETTLDGNAVVVEEQMAKVAETRMRFEAAIGLYQKSLSLLRMAAKSPSR